MKTNGLEITSPITIHKLEIIFDKDINLLHVDNFTKHLAYKIRESVNKRYACASNVPSNYRVSSTKETTVGKLVYEVTLE